MGYVYSTTTDAVTGTVVTNSDTVIYTASLGENVLISAIILTNNGVVPVTCQITDGITTTSGYKLIREADSCIVPYIDAADYKLKSLTIEFPRPYLLEANHSLYAKAGAANGVKAVVQLAAGATGV